MGVGLIAKNGMCGSRAIGGFGAVWRVVLILLFPVLVLFVSCGSSSQANRQDRFVTIGALFPLTGEHSDEGIRSLNGLQQARAEINAAGGVLGKMLDIIVLDDKSCEEHVVRQYRVLMERGVVAIVGSNSSKVTSALAKAAASDGTPVISPTASDPTVSKGHRNVFRVKYLDDRQAEVIADFAVRSFGAKSALVISDGRHESAVEVFKRAFKAGGGRTVTVERFSVQDGFDEILNRHRRYPPDVIFCPVDYVSAAKLAESVHYMGFDRTKLLGTSSWDGILSFAHNLDAMGRVYYTAPFAFDDPSPRVASFSQIYFDNFTYTPISTAALTYSAVQILVAAMDKVGGTNATAVTDAIRSNRFDIVTGRIQFDENNSPSNPNACVHIMQVKGGYYSSVGRVCVNGEGAR
jgi:branched-chain amino acid transport system substrate-binding protein